MGLQGDATSPSKRKSVLNIHWKDWCWNWNSNTLATWCGKTDSFEKTLMLGKIEDRRRRWQRMRCWMSSSTQWTWVWVNSGRWWWTGKPDVLQSMGSQRVGHDWATELNWTPRTRTAVLLHSVGMMLKERKEKKHLLDSLQPPWLELLSHPWEPEQAWFPLLDWGGMETAWQGALHWALFKPLLSAWLWLGSEFRAGSSSRGPWRQ